MDLLQYAYETINGKRSNRLASVTDGVAGSTYSNDLQGIHTYGYDKIGNLVTESATSTNQISWNVYGKISKVQLGTGGSLEYGYDVSGNRVHKIYTKPDASTETTYYVRDATGNTLATYQQSGGTTTWAEQHLYGSSRLGYWKPGMNVTSGDANTLWTAADNKRYELTNHLGNVLAVLSDARNGSMQAGVISMQDYYPFGSAMPGRYGQLDGNGVIGEDVSGSGYRYGFNGKENDNEVKGEGDQQDYGFRIYDPRLGRFLSVDPLTQDYPWYTPYSFAGNKPILFVDLDGAEEGESAVVTGAATRAPRIISAETLARNPRMAVDASGKLVKTKLIEQGAKRQLVAKGLRVVGMTVTLVLTPQDMGNNGYLATGYKSPKNSTADEPVLPLRTITNDPSKISDEELARVAERINNGTADVNDYNLQDEINRRRKEAKDALKQRVTGGKVTFTKLTTLEIETMKELFGGGDEKFIEKVKTGSGTNAGQVDLYKEDSTGDIYIKPKGKPELSGENTGYNVSQLKSTDK